MIETVGRLIADAVLVKVWLSLRLNLTGGFPIGGGRSMNGGGGEFGGINDELTGGERRLNCGGANCDEIPDCDGT